MMKRRTITALFWVLLATHAQYGQANPEGGLSVSPTSIDFGTVPVDSESAPKSITLKNTGSAPVRITQAISSGIDFRVTQRCPERIDPQAECSFQMVFKPAISGERLGMLVIVLTETTSPRYISLSGTGSAQ